MEKKHYHGHRARLKNQFRSMPSSLADYEIMELLLGYVIRRADVKERAKSILAEAKGINGVLATNIRQIKGVGEETILFFDLMKEFLLRTEYQNISGSVKIDSAEIIYKYLRQRIGLAQKEEFLLISLDVKYRLIAVDSIGVGTVDQMVIFIREVVSKALERCASKVIISHNHPSDEIKPSRQDDIVTGKLLDGFKTVDIELLDHIVVSKSDYYSYRGERKL